MPPAETALATKLVYGVMQNMALCDFYAASFSSIDLKKLEPRVLDILRLSIYQIAFLTKIPHRAAVNEAVTLARKHSNPRAAGYLNAVLRKVSMAASAGELPEITGDNEHILSVRYSHPLWLTTELCKLLGQDGAEALLKANNSSDMPLTAQINSLLTDTEKVIRLLQSDGVKALSHEWLENCVEMSETGNLTSLKAFKNGHIYIQDVASRLAVIAANPSRGSFVVDGCAAPGGKSFAAAMMMGNHGRIVACDIHNTKLRLIETGAKRLGIKIIELYEKDSSEQIDEFKGKADVVLADVPCSGFGVIRKKPEIRYKTMEEVAPLQELQKRIIKSLSSCVAPGGVLLYSTCSVMRRENEDVTEWFLSSEQGQFVSEGFTLPGIGEIPGGMITLWPHINGTDGFFICKLRRKR